MRTTWVSAIGVALLFSIFTFAQGQNEDRASRLKQAYERLDAYVAREMKAQGIPGIALALTDRNALLRVSTYGYADTKLRKPVTPDTEFEIGSISKSFTAISLLQLSEDGKYDPRQPVTKYLPWFSIHSKYTPITGHEVMTHTAGLPRDRDDVPSSLYQAAGVRDRWTGYPPGEHFAYSNVGYQIMGYLVEEITQEPLGDALRKRILQPLGMTHTEPMFTHDTYSRLATGYSLLYDDRPYLRSAPLVEATWLEYAGGDGSIVSTASDMAAYLRMLLNRGAGPTGRTLSEKSYELLTQRAIKTDLGENTYYGYGIVTRTIEGHTYIGHNGGMVGYSSAMEGDLDGGYGVVALVNWPGGPGGVPEYALKLLRAVYEGKDLPPVPAEEDPTQVKNAADYAGTYATPEGKKLTLVAEGEKLLLARNGQQIALEQRARDTFYMPHPDFVFFLLRFGRDKGKVAEAFFGDDWYIGERYTGPRTFPTPPEWAAFPGHYRANHAWFNNFRVVLRKGALWLVSPQGDEWAVSPAGDGTFWAGESGEPPREQVSFDTVVRGKTLRCVLSGLSYYRTFTP